MDTLSTAESEGLPASMDMESAFAKLRQIEHGEHLDFYRAQDGTVITVTRTDGICPHDFAVGLRSPDRAEFRPTHIRLLFDLYLKRVSNETQAMKLFYALDLVYQGADPIPLADKVNALAFPMKLDSAETSLYYSQLLMIEQDFNYGPQGCKKSSYDPARNFLMSFIRWTASGEHEIDDIVRAAVRNYPPAKRYALWQPEWMEAF